MCGERRVPTGILSVTAGSSPRVRGTALSRRSRLLSRRFIPACAGNGHPAPRHRSWTPVHPRVCGERWLRSRGLPEIVGSSPRVRGTDLLAGLYTPEERFIPACAGNGSRIRPCPIRPPVHPRVCGERSSEARLVVTPSGSSPRVRGTALTVGQFRLDCRFIPACAGNGRAALETVKTQAVHPRVCGERIESKNLSWYFHRFIPACAGNGAWSWACPPPSSVHPRVCGERVFRLARWRLRVGSSPRVRGTVADQPSVRDAIRFIPACAGNGR